MVFKYLDHRDGKHKTKTLTQEEMILRYVSHIPQYHFKMVRYYGFLSHRKRGRLLSLVYLVLETPASNNAAELMQNSTKDSQAMTRMNVSYVGGEWPSLVLRLVQKP